MERYAWERTVIVLPAFPEREHGHKKVVSRNNEPGTFSFFRANSLVTHNNASLLQPAAEIEGRRKPPTAPRPLHR